MAEYRTLNIYFAAFLLQSPLFKLLFKIEYLGVIHDRNGFYFRFSDPGNHCPGFLDFFQSDSLQVRVSEFSKTMVQLRADQKRSHFSKGAR
jgi:hypothetical protein